MKTTGKKTVRKVAAGLMLLAAVSFSVVGVSAAGNGPGKCEKGKCETGKRFQGHRGPGHFGIPNLTEEQKEKMKAIHTESRKAILPLEAKLGEEEAHLKTLMIADEVNERDLSKTVDKISDLKGNIMLSRLKAKMKVRALLTDEQRVAFDSRAMRLDDGIRGQGFRGGHGGKGHGMPGKGHHGRFDRPDGPRPAPKAPAPEEKGEE